MDPDLSIPDLNNDILLPQAYSLNGYSRSHLRNPFNASYHKKTNPSIYESKDTPENILELHAHKNIRTRPISFQYDRSGINAQKVFKLTFDFLQENGLAERLTKPAVDLEKIISEENQEILDTENIINVPDQGMVRFEEQDPQILHDRFMKQVVSHTIHRSISRPNTSDSGTLYRPTTASTRRSASASAKGKAQIKEETDASVDSNSSRPQTGSTLQNSKKSLKKISKEVNQECDLDRAKFVVDFLQTSPLLTAYRSKGAKSLADWKMVKKTEEQIWDSKQFSVQDFMSEYVKIRDLTSAKHLSKGGNSRPEESPVSEQEKVVRSIDNISFNKNRRFSSVRRGSVMGMRSSVLVKPFINMEIRKYTDDHPDCGKILLLPPLDRRAAEKNLLFKNFRNFKAFKKLSDFTLGEVVGALVLQEFEANRAIFKQGDIGTGWFIILSGTVSVQVSRTGRIEDSFEVVKLHDGDGFGDLALVNAEPRAATVLSTEFCQLVYIDRNDFNRIVKFSYEKELKEKILFLRKIPLLADFSLPALKAVASVMEWKKFQPGEYVLKEGERSKTFCMVRNGEAVVTRAVKIPEREMPVQVVIGKLKRYDYFGEEGIEFLDSDPSKVISDAIRSSIISSKHTKELEVAIISCFDAKNKITRIPKNPIHQISMGEAIRIYYEGKLKIKWDKQKKLFFNKMLQEKYIDPNMNTEKWKKLSSKKKTPWIL